MSEHMMVDETKEEELLDNPQALLYAKSAADVVNVTLKMLLSNIKPGANVFQLCQAGDECINQLCGEKFKKLKKKGVAFPTTVNVNQIVGHYSPVQDENIILKEGDVVRVNLGAHFEGYIATVAQTVFLTDGVVQGRAADAVVAAHKILEATMRMMKPGMKNTDIPHIVNAIANDYQVHLCEGVLSHQLKRFVIDGNQVILMKPTSDHTVDEFAFKEYETYAVDIILNTSDKRFSESVNHKPTIFKRLPENQYALKTKSGRGTFTDILEYNDLPFTLRNFASKDLPRAKLGLKELYQCHLVDKFPVIQSKEGEIVVNLKTTVHILPSGVVSVTGIPDIQQCQSQFNVSNEDAKRVLSTGLKSKKKKQRTKK